MSDPQDQRPSIGRVCKSVAAAFFGVQSGEKHHHDANQGKLHHYVIAGLIATVIFVLALIGVVQLILHLVAHG